MRLFDDYPGTKGFGGEAGDLPRRAPPEDYIAHLGLLRPDMQGRFAQARDVCRREGFGALLRKGSAFVFWRSLGPLFVGRAAKDLRAKAEDATDIRSAVSLALEYSYLGLRIAPLQVREEIEGLLSDVASKRPRTVLEIGTAKGGTLFLFARVTSEDAKLISVDLPGGEFGGGYPAWKEHLYASFARGGQRIHLLRADSHDQRTKESVAKLVGETGVDLLFIDGDHTYEGVKRDFELYSPLVSKGGLIALHDILPHATDTGVGVHRLWDEVRGSYDSHEIVGDRAQGWAGIGVLSVR